MFNNRKIIQPLYYSKSFILLKLTASVETLCISGISSAQDLAFTAKSVESCKFNQERIRPSPKATWNGQIP